MYLNLKPPTEMNQKDKKQLSIVLKEIKGLSPFLDVITTQAKEKRDLIMIIDMLSKLSPTLEELKDNEDDKYYNLTEKQQESYRGEVIRNTADNLERAYDALIECISYIELIIEE